MTRDSLGGRSLSSSKKAIVAVFAVALMIFAGMAVFAEKTSASSENEQYYVYLESDGAISNENLNKLGVLGKGTSTGIDPSTHTLTLDSINCVCTGDYQTALRFYGHGTPTKISIYLKGENFITLNSSANSKALDALSVGGYGTDFEIKGEKGSSLTISVNSSGSPTSTIALAVYGYNTSIDGVTIVANDAGAESCKESYGVKVSGCPLKINNSNITATGGTTTDGKSHGLYFNDSTNTSEIVNSVVTAKGFTADGKGYGMYITGETSSYGVTITNSEFYASGNNSAMISVDSDSNEHEFSTSLITGCPPLKYATTTLPTESDWKDLTGASISLSYLSVKAESPKYTVTYDLDGGTGTLPTQEPLVEDEKFTVKGTDAVKAGVPFSYWTTDGTDMILPGAEMTMGTSDIVLKAVYKSSVVTHTVTYDTNGGSGTAPTQTPVKEGSSFTVQGIGSVTKAGCTFGGWTIVGDSTQHVYKEGDAITMGTSDIVLKAVWNESPGPEPPTPTEDMDMPIICLCLVVVVIIAILALAWCGRND